MSKVIKILEHIFFNILEDQNYRFYFNEYFIEKDLYRDAITLTNPYGLLSSSENLSDFVNQFYDENVLGDIESLYSFIIHGLYDKNKILNQATASPYPISKYNQVINIIKTREDYPLQEKVKNKCLLKNSYPTSQVIANYVDDFENNQLVSVFKKGKNWHLSFIKPTYWYDDLNLEFNKIQNNIIMNNENYSISLEYTILSIERPWLIESIFTLPYAHSFYNKGTISNGCKNDNNGCFPFITTHMIVAKNIKISGSICIESSAYQMIGIHRKTIPYFPKE